MGRKEGDAEQRELQNMNLVAAMEEFKEEESAHDERRMLQGIFARSVNSAYDHEQIVNGPQKAKADVGVLQREAWQDVFTAAATSGAKIYHESSVGAGLPVISTLKDLVETGDKVTKIEGVFSGTMSFLFNSFAPTSGQGGAWSEEVKKAKSLGYTEPDPRDDLNGLDVARKLTILARLVGLPVESPTAFPVQSLIPKELESCGSGDEFLEKLGAFDQQMEETKAKAQKVGKVVRFVGSINVAANKVKVGLEMFDPTHPIAALKGSDNIISFYTERYGSNPLIVQGAGAGGEVTAMGVTGDLLKVVAQIS
ncbi:homoserine dehydrogenase [Ophiocordyceps sinensis CO18]|uniref:Homoserine dehydrogenase n=1 Tax=Ophiocordyceps sinensis (strain Co18 / CGMCC 3.14243) TaxID=911162 RepID=T5AC54_OPHSC|nr:homoserine dehydrogenase [Ophiocordyceps sinensis CO18]